MPYKFFVSALAVGTLLICGTSLFAEDDILVKQPALGTVLLPGQTPDSMSFTFQGRNWTANSFHVDTIAEQKVSSGQKQYLFEIAGVSGGDTIFLRFPTLMEASRMSYPAILSSMPSMSTHSAKKQFGDFMQLDTGLYNVDTPPWIDYAPSFDCELRQSTINATDGKIVTTTKYFSQTANNYNPKGNIHITLIDSTVMIGTFTFDASQTNDSPTARFENGFFHFSFKHQNQPVYAKSQPLAENK